MLTFAQPWLLILLPIGALVMWVWSRRRRPAVRFPDTSLLANLPPGRVRWARWLGIGFRAAGLLLLLIALAGPRWPDQSSRISAEGIAIEMVVDASGSMATPDFTWEGKPISRLEAVKRAFRLFVEGDKQPSEQTLLEGRPNDLIGLVTFARWPQTTCPLTLSHSVLLRLLDAEKPRSTPTESETNIGDAIAWGLVRLEKTNAKRKVMILLSDGEHNVPPPALTPRQAAQLAANQGIPIYVIDAGGVTGIPEGPITQSNEVDKESAKRIRASAESTMKSIAQITGGRHFKAGDTETLLEVYREIDRMERQEARSFLYRRYFEGYSLLGLASFGFLAMIGLLELTVLRKAP
jgi:Ca-activated chloride channel family protein